MRLPNAILGASLDGVAAIFVAAYLVAVVYQGNANVKALGSAIVADGPGFLEWAISLYILSLLVNIKGPVGDVFAALVALAVLVLVFKLMQGKGAGLFQQYGQGQLSLFQLVAKLATN